MVNDLTLQRLDERLSGRTPQFIDLNTTARAFEKGRATNVLDHADQALTGRGPKGHLVGTDGHSSIQTRLTFWACTQLRWRRGRTIFLSLGTASGSQACWNRWAFSDSNKA